MTWKPLRIFSVLIPILLILALVSCSGRHSKGYVVNDNIPDYFFGFKLGCSTDDAIAELKDGDFKLRADISDDEFIHFEPIFTDSFKYEGTKWAMLDLNAMHGYVYGVGFVNSYGTQKEALADFLKVREWALCRYKPMVLKPKGDKIKEVLFMGDEVAGGLTLMKYKSVGGDSLFAVQLLYQKKPEK